jgi:hypothetical protein
MSGLRGQVVELGSPDHPANPEHPDHEKWKAKVAEQAKRPDHPAHPDHPDHAHFMARVRKSQGLTDG